MGISDFNMGLSYWILIISIQIFNVSCDELCSGTHFGLNVTQEVGSHLSLVCPLVKCPAQSITWYRSDTVEGGRYPLVSNHPIEFNIRNLMPEDSGWYWCTSEGFQSGVYLQVLRNKQDREEKAYSTFALRSTSTPTPMQVTPGRGNADRLSVYKTYGSGWSEYQSQRTRLLMELEEMISRYMKPINKQLDDIYIRVGKMEKKIQEMGVEAHIIRTCCL